MPRGVPLRLTPMFPRVTAVLVAHHGGDHLRRSLEAIRAQRRAPDALVVVLTEADAEAREIAAASSPTHIVELSQRLSFGEAVRAADRVLDAPESDADALWLLAEDTAPAPEALERLVATLETAKSVAIAGPKLREWDDPDRIATFGRTMTRFGRSVALVSGELDQGQHDGLSDVLGLDSAAILVRHTVWRSLDGFDPALPTVDDALDFSIRARLAGHRVSVVPAAHVRFAGDGVVGPSTDPRARAARRRTRAARAAALHRRLVYAPAVVVPVHWLSFLPLAIIRSIRLLLVKSPGAITGEFAAALGTMFSGMRVARARRRLKAARTTGWSAIAPLRMPPDEVRRRRQHAAEERRARARGRKHELQFLGTGGGWVLLVSVVASVGLFSWLLGAGGLSGGGILPLSSGLDELWRNAAYGWRDIGAGFVGAADPFAGVLAVLGSLSFWAPSFALVLLWLVAVPVATLGAWFAASRLTERGSVRAVAALVWGLAPPLLVALGDGRPGAVLAHALLGWLAFAVFGAATSWAAAATASLLFAAVIAAAPSLAPALLLAWIVGLAVSGRAAVRLAGLPLPAFVLFAPLVFEQLGRGTPIALFADPGLPLQGTVPSVWQLALGFPGEPWGDWSALLGDGAVIDPKLLLTLLVVPLIVAALAAVLAPGIRGAVLSLGVVLLGFATAVAASHVAVAVAGPAAVQLWTGAGLSLAWLGLVLAAVIALSAVRRGGAVLAWLVAVTTIAAVVPTGLAIATAATAIGPAAERTLPAFVGAEADTDPRVTTLRIQPESDGSIRSTLEHGTGTTLDEQSTLEQTLEEMSESEEQLAEVAGNLASRSGFDPDAAIRDFGVSFVLLAPPNGDDREAEATANRARTALDGNSALIAVGETDFGTLWRFSAAEPDVPAAQIPPNAGGALTAIISAVQLVVLGATLLLSIPTGAGREADRRPVQRRPRRPAKSRKSAAAEGAAGAPDDGAPAYGAPAEVGDQTEASAPDAAVEPAAPGDPAPADEPAGPGETVDDSDATSSEASEPPAADPAEPSSSAGSPPPDEKPANEASDRPEPTETKGDDDAN